MKNKYALSELTALFNYNKQDKELTNNVIILSMIYLPPLLVLTILFIKPLL